MSVDRSSMGHGGGLYVTDNTARTWSEPNEGGIYCLTAGTPTVIKLKGVHGVSDGADANVAAAMVAGQWLPGRVTAFTGDGTGKFIIYA